MAVRGGEGRQDSHSLAGMGSECGPAEGLGLLMSKLTRAHR